MVSIQRQAVRISRASRALTPSKEEDERENPQQLKCEGEQKETRRTHMQTDCPTNVTRRNVMRGNSKVRQKRREASQA